ncbi:MAG: hypothetical protein ACI4OT_02965 [Bacilli bacterium]
MEELNRRLKQIKIENYIWIIYLIIIGLSLYANSFEEKYFIYNDHCAKNKYRNINIIVFIIVTCIYFYFFIDNYEDVKNLKSTDSKKKQDLTNLSFIATTLVLISGIIFLYIIISDENIETEIAFN